MHNFFKNIPGPFYMRLKVFNSI